MSEGKGPFVTMFMFQAFGRFLSVFAVFSVVFQVISTRGESTNALAPIQIIVNGTDVAGGEITVTNSPSIRIEPNYGADRVYYTTDGSEPSIVNGMKYGGGIGWRTFERGCA